MVKIYELDTAYFPPSPRRGATCVKFALIEDVKADFAEVLNNLNDDLQMSESGVSGYVTEKEVVEAVKKYTLKVLKEKYKAYGGK